MKVTYWYSRHPDDSNVYSIRTKTRKEAKALVDAENALRKSNHHTSGELWEAPKKITTEYADAFDLVKQCTGEGGLWGEDY